MQLFRLQADQSRRDMNMFLFEDRKCLQSASPTLLYSGAAAAATGKKGFRVGGRLPELSGNTSMRRRVPRRCIILAEAFALACGGRLMPIHDWTRVEAGIFHDFHHSW